MSKSFRHFFSNFRKNGIGCLQRMVDVLIRMGGADEPVVVRVEKCATADHAPAEGLDMIEVRVNVNIMMAAADLDAETGPDIV
jgi:hypothetical protein